MTQISTSKQAQANTEHARSTQCPFQPTRPHRAQHAHTANGSPCRQNIFALSCVLPPVQSAWYAANTPTNKPRQDTCECPACLLLVASQLSFSCCRMRTPNQQATNTLPGQPTQQGAPPLVTHKSLPLAHLLTSPAKRLSTHHDHPPASRQAACQHRSNLRLQGYRVTPTVTLKSETKPTAAAAATCCCSHQLLMPCQPSAASARPVLLPAWQ